MSKSKSRCMRPCFGFMAIHAGLRVMISNQAVMSVNVSNSALATGSDFGDSPNTKERGVFDEKAVTVAMLSARQLAKRDLQSSQKTTSSGVPMLQEDVALSLVPSLRSCGSRTATR